MVNEGCYAPCSSQAGRQRWSFRPSLMNAAVGDNFVSGPLVHTIQTSQKSECVPIFGGSLALPSCLGPAMRPQGPSDSDLKPKACILQQSPAEESRN